MKCCSQALRSTCVDLQFLFTNDPKTPIRLELSNVSSAEPTLTVLVHKIILCSFGLIFVVTYCYVRSTDENFPSGVGPVRTKVTT